MLGLGGKEEKLCLSSNIKGVNQLFCYGTLIKDIEQTIRDMESFKNECYNVSKKYKTQSGFFITFTIGDER